MVCQCWNSWQWESFEHLLAKLQLYSKLLLREKNKYYYLVGCAFYPQQSALAGSCPFLSINTSNVKPRSGVLPAGTSILTYTRKKWLILPPRKELCQRRSTRSNEVPSSCLPWSRVETISTCSMTIDTANVSIATVKRHLLLRVFVFLMSGWRVYVLRLSCLSTLQLWDPSSGVAWKRSSSRREIYLSPKVSILSFSVNLRAGVWLWPSL